VLVQVPGETQVPDITWQRKALRCRQQAREAA
jgi:hypothetical protein